MSNETNRGAGCSPRRIASLVLALLAGWAPPLSAFPALTLEEAVALAQQQDPWLRGSELRQEAIEANSVSAGSLPDPMVSVGLANLPTDTFDFDQEAMTQFKVGLSQVFPRGESRSLRRKQLQLAAGEQPLLREERRARVALEVSGLWLEAFRASETVRLIERDRSLFEHLVDVAEASYATARGRARQQDLVRAQLELTRLEDRLTRLDEAYAMATSRLGEWLGDAFPAMPREGASPAPALPALELAAPGLLQNPPAGELAMRLGRHPAILGLEQRIEASDAGIELAEQQYRPQWQVSASYGYREDDPAGRDRADFFSVGLAFDLPLFTTSRQDPQVRAAIAEREAVRTEKLLALRRMAAALETQRLRLQRLEQRRQLYESRLLQEISDQAQAALTAYTNDEGDFSEVVRASIDVLNARIEALDIEIDRLKTISQLNYYLTESAINREEQDDEGQ